MKVPKSSHAIEDERDFQLVVTLPPSTENVSKDVDLELKEER
jgi:hypothetical protein